MDKFAAMQAFVRVVEAGTFTKAADSLNLPKPTVTRLIQMLETHLQTKLLNRTTRRVTVTADGAAAYDRALRLLSEMDELESSMSRAKANPRGRLRIDVGASVAQLLLIPALPDFHAKYPDIQIDLGVSDRPVDLIGENVDCVLRGGEITDQSLVARKIGDFHTILCATPEYIKRHGVPQHPNDLEGDAHRVVRLGRDFVDEELRARQGGQGRGNLGLARGALADDRQRIHGPVRKGVDLGLEEIDRPGHTQNQDEWTRQQPGIKVPAPDGSIVRPKLVEEVR